MPHRFVAVLQIDTFVLKDLASQKFMSGVASTPIQVYAVLRLVRSGERVKSRRTAIALWLTRWLRYRLLKCCVESHVKCVVDTRRSVGV